MRANHPEGQEHVMPFFNEPCRGPRFGLFEHDNEMRGYVRKRSCNIRIGNHNGFAVVEVAITWRELTKRGRQKRDCLAWRLQ